MMATAGPNIDNLTDPNRNIYFDFIEFTIDNSGYHGNTTRVDAFGFLVQMRLVNKAGNYDRGEPEARNPRWNLCSLHTEGPERVQGTGTNPVTLSLLRPFTDRCAWAEQTRITSPDAPFPRVIFCYGRELPCAKSQVDAAINRHVYNDSANWNNPAAYYKGAPANYYAKFWHDHGI